MIAQTNLENIILSEIQSQSKNTTYFMISSIRNVQNTQIHRDRKEIESWTGSEQEGVVTGTDY